MKINIWRGTELNWCSWCQELDDDDVVFTNPHRAILWLGGFILFSHLFSYPNRGKTHQTFQWGTVWLWSRLLTLIVCLEKFTKSACWGSCTYIYYYLAQSRDGFFNGVKKRNHALLLYNSGEVKYNNIGLDQSNHTCFWLLYYISNFRALFTGASFTWHHNSFWIWLNFWAMKNSMLYKNVYVMITEFWNAQRIFFKLSFPPNILSHIFLLTIFR